MSPAADEIELVAEHVSALEQRLAALEARVERLVSGQTPVPVTLNVATPVWWDPASGPMLMPRASTAGSGR
ncbi:MAG: hypothetical protein K2X74_19005 [Acetobacteraceae bacterium]|nr:hypothetical protein [Acetobacteraceae bacterium]